MFAQKTPPTALTLSFNETWNSLYFQELSLIRIQLFEDYTLRFLILNYLNYKRYWLYKFSVKKTIGIYFIGVKCLSPGPRKRFKSIKPIRLRASAIRYGYRRRFKQSIRSYYRSSVALNFLKVNNYLYRLFHGITPIKQVVNRYKIWLKLKKRIRLFLRHRLWKVVPNISKLQPISLKNLRLLKKRFKRVRRRVILKRRRFKRVYKRYKRKYKRILVIKFRKRSDLKAIVNRQRYRFKVKMLKRLKKRKVKRKYFKFSLTLVQRAHLSCILPKIKTVHYQKAAITFYGLKLFRHTGLRRYRLHKRLGKKRIKNPKRIKLLKRRCRRLDYTIRRFMRKIYRQRRKAFYKNRYQKERFLKTRRNKRFKQYGFSKGRFTYKEKPPVRFDDWKLRYRRITVRIQREIQRNKPRKSRRTIYAVWDRRKAKDLAARAARRKIEQEKRAAARLAIFKKQEAVLKKDVKYQEQRARRKEWFRTRTDCRAWEAEAREKRREQQQAINQKAPITGSIGRQDMKQQSFQPPVLISGTKRFYSELPNWKPLKLKQYTFKPKNVLLLKSNVAGQSLNVIIKNVKQLQFRSKMRGIKYKTAVYNPVIRAKIRKYLIYIQVIFKKFFKRKTKTWRIILYRWMRKWGRKYRFLVNWRRRLSSFLFVKTATERLTKSLCLFQFQIRSWKYRTFAKYKYPANMKRVKKALALQLLITTFFAIKKASPLAIIDLLRRLLSGRHRHFHQLRAFSSALRFWFVDKTSGQVKSNNICQGVKIEVIGKIDGADRTRTWRYILGRLPASDFRQNFQYEQSIIATKYGILHLHVWLYFRSHFYNKKIRKRPAKLFLHKRRKNQRYKHIYLAKN